MKHHFLQRGLMAQFILFCCLFTIPVRALSGEGSGLIEQIQVTGLHRLEESAVLDKITFKAGSTLNHDDVADSIRALHSMGYFEEIQAFQDSLPNGNSKIRFVLTERPVIREIIFSGNINQSEKELEEIIKLKEWNIYHEGKVLDDVRLLLKHYEEKGYFLARVHHVVEPIDNDRNEVRLKYLIEDQDKVTIRNIRFIGNTHFSEEVLKKQFQFTAEGGLFSLLSSSGSYKENQFKYDMMLLSTFYLNRGFVRFSADPPQINISDDKRNMMITIVVHEGEPYTLTGIDFSGDLLFSKDELNASVGLRSGEIFDFSRHQKDVQILSEKMQDLGFAFVNVNPRMEFDDERKEMRINYEFEKGKKAYFGRIHIVGNTRTNDEVIRRELRVREGEKFNGTRLRVSKERLERLGFFAPGEISVKQMPRKGLDDTIDLEITVKERQTGSVNVGAGFGTVQGFFFQGQFSESNFLGRGQVLAAQLQWGAQRLFRDVQLSFTDPYAFETRWSLGGELVYRSYAIRNRHSVTKSGFSVRTGYPIKDDLSAFLTYRLEYMEIFDLVRADLDVSLDKGALSSVTLQFVNDHRNNRIEPSGGSYQSASFELAGLGLDKTFGRFNLNNRFYYRVIDDLVFRHNVEFGQMFRLWGNGIPPTEKYFLGGPANLRGWSLWGLGPTFRYEKNGRNVDEPLGSNTQAFTMFELEYPLIREAGLKFVAFYDAGNAWSEFPALDSGFKLFHNYGWGVRWFSPFGPLRFEWAFPINRQPGEDSFQFFFNMGTPF